MQQMVLNYIDFRLNVSVNDGYIMDYKKVQSQLVFMHKSIGLEFALSFC